MHPALAYDWKQYPVIKIVGALSIGIILQWNLELARSIGWTLLLLAAAILVCIHSLSSYYRFRAPIVAGFVTILLYISIGALLTAYKDVRNHERGLLNVYHENDIVFAEIISPAENKPRSIKLIARVFKLRGSHELSTIGKVNIYITGYGKLNADSSSSIPGPGDIVVFMKKMNRITNSGNPGGFDYKRYCLFQGITHQVFLKTNELISRKNDAKSFQRLIHSIRKRIIVTLRRYIKGDKERGLAEALLIGYKQDLDQGLVQAYTNTGVVHIIAISGLHVGLIYRILLIITIPLKKSKRVTWLIPLIVVGGLWLFTFIAGAQPSILRSALMFTRIILGNHISRKPSPINSLAVSALLLLVHNPFWLWDVGFQLSYAAVLSIVLFGKPFYHLLYVRNKILDHIWQVNAITISAQVLTIPFCIYYFHQFPNYFILSNLVAVPLSTCILLVEIILYALAFIPGVAYPVGWLVEWLIRIMNGYIDIIDSIPGSVWSGIYINLFQAICLLTALASAFYAVLKKSNLLLACFFVSAISLLLVRFILFYNAGRQQLIIIYNIPGKSSMEIITGRRSMYIGDSIVKGSPVDKFNIQPARTMLRIKPMNEINKQICFSLQYRNKRIILNSSGQYLLQRSIHHIDALIFSGNENSSINSMQLTVKPKQVVFDSSVPPWRSGKIKKECDSLQIAWHDVSVSGAFVMKLR